MQPKSLRVFALSSLLTLGVHFDAGAAPVTIFGARSCGAWLKNKSTGGMAATAQNGWLAGYMSGLAIGMNSDALDKTDLDSMELWVSNYCEKNPLDSTSTAGTALFFELKRREKQ